MRHASHRGAAAVAGKRRHGVVWNVLGVLMEILFTLAAVCALYIVWQMWWTGVQAEHEQVEARQSMPELVAGIVRRECLSLEKIMFKGAYKFVF